MDEGGVAIEPSPTVKCRQTDQQVGVNPTSNLLGPTIATRVHVDSGLTAQALVGHFIPPMTGEYASKMDGLDSLPNGGDGRGAIPL